MNENRTLGDGDDRPPICPACGVTMGVVDEDEVARFACLECGFSDKANLQSIYGDRPRDLER